MLTLTNSEPEGRTLVVLVEQEGTCRLVHLRRGDSYRLSPRDRLISYKTLPLHRGMTIDTGRIGAQMGELT